jgi:hypothetical protein
MPAPTTGLTGTFGAFAASATSHLLEAKREFSHRFLTARAGPSAGAMLFAAGIDPDPKSNVVGVGIGEKMDGNQPTGVAALKFFVRQKIAPEFLSASAMLPASVEGLPTDVEEIGLILPQAKAKPKRAKKAGPKKPPPKKPPTPPATLPNPKGRFRPIAPGSSVGFQFPASVGMVMAGTFGALVLDADGRQCILSNNHVLANERTKTGGGLPNGAPIFQPGLLDGGRAPQDKVAELANVVAYDVNGTNTVDAAIAKVDAGVRAVPDILHIGRPTGTGSAAMDMIVHKFGRTSTYTVGRVVSIDTDVNVGFSAGTLVFESQIIIQGIVANQPFSQSGDSGSLILERGTNRAVGLLFAGSVTHTIANHIDTVLQALSVRLA